MMKTLETDRLILREWQLSDVEDMFEYAHSPEVGPAAGWMPHQSIENTKEYLAETISDGDTWALVFKPENKVIGSVGLHNSRLRDADIQSKSIGYVMNNKYWGKGIMTEAVKAVIEFAFTDMNLQVLSLEHFDFNQRSKHVIQKCGFYFEGIIKNNLCFNGRSIDLWIYSLTKDEWLGNGTRQQPNHRFYQNRQCEFFPCHKIDNEDDFSCQFCYCPLYCLEDCGGDFVILDNGIKDCSACLRPHTNYDAIVDRLK